MRDLLWYVFVVTALGVGAQDVTYKKPEIYSLKIYSDIKYRFATTRVTSRVKNTDTAPREAVFDITLPNEAFITNLTLEIDGEIIQGEIKQKAEAKAQYQAAQRRGESAGYIETRHRETNRFNLAITAAAKSKVSFNLTYQELLQRKHGYYEQVIYIDPGQPVPEMDIAVSILESRNITTLTIPPLRNDIGTALLGLESITVIQRPTPFSALVTFVPDVAQQLAQTERGMAGQFVVRYDVDRQMDAGDIMVVNGYFVHFFAPEGLEAIPNDLLFILDTSGSMLGQKLKQLKQSMMSILDVLNEGDRINIMTFSDSTNFWQNAMQDISDEDILQGAKSFVQSFDDRGGQLLTYHNRTNINEALLKGIRFLKRIGELDKDTRSPVIVFLTDGKATSGERNWANILTNIRGFNSAANIPIFSLAFGASADYDNLKKIAIENNGFGRRIYEDSDAAMQISGFYNEISLTLLKNLTFNYLDASVSDLTKHQYENYFQGSEVVIAGRLEEDDDGGTGRVVPKMRVTGNSMGGPRVLVLSTQFQPIFQDVENLTRLGDYEKITEKVWAYLTIKQLLEQELVTPGFNEKEAINKRILELSLQYNFVTPLTAMVVTKDGEPLSSENQPVPMLIPETSQPSGGRTLARKYYHRPMSARYNGGGPFLTNLFTPGQDLSPPHYYRSRPFLTNLLALGQDLRPPYYYRNPFLTDRDYWDAIIGSLTLHYRSRPFLTNRYYGDAIMGSPLPQYRSRLFLTNRHPLGLGLRSDRFSWVSVPRLHMQGMDYPSHFIPPSKSQDETSDKKLKRKGEKARRRKAFKAPLMVEMNTVDMPLCFRLYSDDVSTGEHYLLFRDKNKGINVTAEIATQRFRRRKVTSTVTSVILAGPDPVSKVTSLDDGSVLVQDLLSGGAVTVNNYTFQAGGAFRLFLTSVGSNSLRIFVDSVNAKELSNEGILCSILSKKVKVKQRAGISTKKGRQAAVLKVNKGKVKAVLLQDQPANGKINDTASCWLLRKEALFYDMPSYKLKTTE